jgi:tetratricopeptide (TPR) repeat protein
LTPQPIPAQVARLVKQANAAAADGDLEAAQNAAQAAVDKAAESLHAAGQATAHYTLAQMLWSDEHASIELARTHAERALTLAHKHSDEYYLAMTLLARIEAGLGNLERAWTMTDTLLAAYQKKNRPSGIADALRSLGDLALKQGDLAGAGEYYSQSLDLYRSQVRDPLNLGGLLLSLGSLKFREGDLDSAMLYWAEAEDVGRLEGNFQIVSLAQYNLSLLGSESDG